jgi:hypothetical protein
MGQYVVVEGFGDNSSGLAACDGVEVVRYFATEAEAISCAVEHWENDGLDVDGFSVPSSRLQSFWVQVFEASELCVIDGELELIDGGK